MIFRIPYVFTVAGVRKGHRNLEPYVVGGHVDVDVRDVPEADAPVSMRWSGDFRGRERPRERRWLDGANWKPAAEGLQPGDTAPFTPEMLAGLGAVEQEAATRRRMDCHPSRDLEPALWPGDAPRISSLLTSPGTRSPADSVSQFDAAGFREIVWSDREERAAAAARRAAARLAFIGGSLWIPGGEPCYLVVRHRAPLGEAVNASRVDISLTDRISEGSAACYLAYFRADRLEDARAEAREAEAWSGRRFEVPREIEVLIPEAVRFDDDLECLMRSARQAAGYYRDEMHRMPSGRLGAWAQLRDALEGGSGPEEIARLLDGFARQCPETSRVRQLADYALARWEARPIQAMSMGM